MKSMAIQGMVVALVIAAGLVTGACRAAGPPAAGTSSGGEIAASVGDELRALAVDTGDGSLVKATAQGLYRSADGRVDDARFQGQVEQGRNQSGSHILQEPMVARKPPVAVGSDSDERYALNELEVGMPVGETQ